MLQPPCNYEFFYRQARSSKEVTKGMEILGSLEVVRTPRILGLELSSVNAFYRIRINNQFFSSKEYRRVKKRNSHTILYRKKDEETYHFASVVKYFYSNANAIHVLALVQKFRNIRIISEDISIYEVTSSDVYEVIDLFSVSIEKCFYVSVGENSHYVCRFPCKFLGD